MRSRIARGSLVFAVVAPLAYLAQRLFERWQAGPGDPLAIVREVHTAFYWRVATALWLALVVAMLAARRESGERQGPSWTPFAAAAGFTVLVLSLAALYP